MESLKGVLDVVDTIMKYENLDLKVNWLKRKVEVLEAKEDDIYKELEYAESLSLKKRRKEVEIWLRGIAEMKLQVHRTEQQVQEFKGILFPNLQLHRQLDRLTAETDVLHNQCNFPQDRFGVTFPTANSVGRMFEQNKKMICESLRDNNVLSIGVYGMGGVEKTTLLTHVNNEITQNCSVCWVTVSQKFTIHKIQDDIAKALKLRLEEDDERKRAAELANSLERKKNLVLILDDVWEYINLLEVGISLRENGCKLILSTRSIEVCNKMNFQQKIKIMPLCVEESWDLFRNKLGDDMELSPQIEEVAKSLVKECAGLPLGIITMARSMKGKYDIFEWNNALENMRESKLGHDNMELKVFQVLKYSYDMLQDSTVQQCFLDCSLYPEDYWIAREELISQFIDEGLIKGIKSRQAEIYRGETILNKLVNACLLENVERYATRCVRMHDLVRDLALQITSKSPLFMVEAGLSLKEIPDEEQWVEDLVKVSLMRNDLTSIPDTALPRCPKLSTMMLNSNKRLNFIPDWFLNI